jgi:hypothetical protein
MGRPLKIAKAQAVITITATAATTNIITTSANLTSSGVIKGMTFIPATTVGGLTGGVTYYVLEVLSDTTFLASATDLSAWFAFCAIFERSSKLLWFTSSVNSLCLR